MEKTVFLWCHFLGYGNGVKNFHYHDFWYGNENFWNIFFSKKVSRCPPRVKMLIDEKSDGVIFKVAS
jgi:hypothetical protein